MVFVSISLLATLRAAAAPLLHAAYAPKNLVVCGQVLVQGNFSLVALRILTLRSRAAMSDNPAAQIGIKRFGHFITQCSVLVLELYIPALRKLLVPARYYSAQRCSFRLAPRVAALLLGVLCPGFHLGLFEDSIQKLLATQ
jgi:hypothetical protein